MHDSHNTNDSSVAPWGTCDRTVGLGCPRNSHACTMTLMTSLLMMPEWIRSSKCPRGEREYTLHLLLINHPKLFPPIEVVAGLSDNDIVYAESQINPTRVHQKAREVRCYGKADWDSLCSATQLTTTILDTHAEHPDHEAIWSDHKAGLNERIDQFIP